MRQPVEFVADEIIVHRGASESCYSAFAEY